MAVLSVNETTTVVLKSTVVLSAADPGRPVGHTTVGLVHLSGAARATLNAARHLQRRSAVVARTLRQLNLEGVEDDGSPVWGVWGFQGLTAAGHAARFGSHHLPGARMAMAGGDNGDSVRAQRPAPATTGRARHRRLAADWYTDCTAAEPLPACVAAVKATLATPLECFVRLQAERTQAVAAECTRFLHDVSPG